MTSLAKTEKKSIKLMKADIDLLQRRDLDFEAFDENDEDVLK